MSEDWSVLDYSESYRDHQKWMVIQAFSGRSGVSERGKRKKNSLKGESKSDDDDGWENLSSFHSNRVRSFSMTDKSGTGHIPGTSWQGSNGQGRYHRPGPPSSVDSINGRFHFRKFVHSNPVKKIQTDPSQSWQPIGPPRVSSRRRRQKRKRGSKLATIEENPTPKSDDSPQVIEMKNVSSIVKDAFNWREMERDSLIDKSNEIAKTGFLGKLNLREIPSFVMDRLRQEMFRGLLWRYKNDGQRGSSQCRENWQRMSIQARYLVAPLSSIDELNRLFSVHSTVTVSELLSVRDETGFSHLEKPPYLRACVFGDHLRSMKARFEARRRMRDQARSFGLKIDMVRDPFIRNHHQSRFTPTCHIHGDGSVFVCDCWQSNFTQVPTEMSWRDENLNEFRNTIYEEERLSGSD